MTKKAVRIIYLSIYLYKVEIYVSISVCPEDVDNGFSKNSQTIPLCRDCLQNQFSYLFFVCSTGPQRLMLNLTRYNN